MSKIPHSPAVCQAVSELAVRKARENARSMGWSDRTIEALVPLNRDAGVAGIQTKLKFIMHQERGTKPFLMWWVQNRVLPMGCKQGDGPHFRKGGHVGEPGYVNIPHVGRVYRNQRWRHPGIRAKHFLSQALTDAIEESKPLLHEDIQRFLKGATRD